MAGGSEDGYVTLPKINVIDFDGTLVATGSENDKVEINGTADGRVYACQDHPYFLQTLATYTGPNTNSGAAILMDPTGLGLCVYVNEIHVYANTSSTFKFYNNSTNTISSLVTKYTIKVPAGGGDRIHKFDPPYKMAVTNATFAFTTDATVNTYFISGFFGE